LIRYGRRPRLAIRSSAVWSKRGEVVALGVKPPERFGEWTRGVARGRADVPLWFPREAAPERSREPARSRAFPTEAVGSRALLAPFSTRLPPELVERLRIAAPQLHLRQGEIAAIAIDRYLQQHGY